MNVDTHKEREHFFGAAKLVAAITILSRVLGLVRDIAIITFGANRLMDSFWTAFRVPNVFRRLFGEGALSAAFVPVFTAVSEAEGWQKARLVLANCLGILALLLAGLVLLLECALVVCLWLWPGDWDRVLLLQLIMLLLPFMFTVCLLALGSAALNCKGHFAYPAFAPILLNVFLIVGAFVAKRCFGTGDWPSLFVLSVFVLLAGIVQLAGVFWLLATFKLAALPRLRPVDEEVKHIAALTLPMMVPLGLRQLSSLFDSFYAWFMTATAEAPTFRLLGWELAKPLEPGVVTCLYASERLYNFPLGILAISLATAVFPLFSRYAARNDLPQLRRATNRAIRMSLFLGIPAGVALILLARPAVMLIYRHGEFTANDATRAGRILQMYCLGMGAYFWNHVLLRAFFAQKDIRTPLKISCFLAAANIILVAGLVFTPLKGSGIGLATAITATVNAVWLTWVLRRRWGQIGLRSILISIARVLVASGLMAAMIWLVQTTLPQAVGREDTLLGRLIVLAVSCITGAGVFLLATAVMRCSELGELLRRRQPGPTTEGDSTDDTTI